MGLSGVLLISPVIERAQATTVVACSEWHTPAVAAPTAFLSLHFGCSKSRHNSHFSRGTNYLMAQS